MLAYLKDITGPPAVCLQSNQACGQCSQHGISLHPVAFGQTRDLCEDPVCGLQTLDETLDLIATVFIFHQSFAAELSNKQNKSLKFFNKI